VAHTTDGEAELAGRFHSITVVRHRPRTVGTWHVTTASRLTADCLAQLLGGQVHQDHANALAEILTTTSIVDILLADSDALHIGWQRIGHGICDGTTQDNGRPCACPETIALRRAAAKQGYGCRPRAEVRFWLKGDPAMGVFDFAGEDWSFIELVTAMRAALSIRAGNRPIRARLGLRRSLHTLRSGRVLAYTRPVIEGLTVPTGAVD